MNFKTLALLSLISASCACSSIPSSNTRSSEPFEPPFSLNDLSYVLSSLIKFSNTRPAVEDKDYSSRKYLNNNGGILNKTAIIKLPDKSIVATKITNKGMFLISGYQEKSDFWIDISKSKNQTFFITVRDAYPSNILAYFSISEAGGKVTDEYVEIVD